ncbi:MAG: DUF6982 domain-containing protein [Planctomycetota bacterium]
MEDSVVARYQNGRVVKGVTRDFHPTRHSFHIYPTEETYLKKGVEILVSELKALFFVKTLEGNPQYIKKREFPEEYIKSRGKKCIVAFKDGEIMYAYSQAYDKAKAGFFVFPADEGTNNKRVFVIRDAIIGIQFIEDDSMDTKVGDDGMVRAIHPETPLRPADKAEERADEPKARADEPKERVDDDSWPTTGGPEVLKPDVRQNYEEIISCHRKGHEKDFSRAFQALLKKVWFDDITRYVTKRGLLSFGRKTRYFSRGGIKEMGKSNEPEIGWPSFETVPKFSNSLSEMYSDGKRLEHFSMDERNRIRKYITRIHNDHSRPIYLVAGGLVVWNGFDLAFYDSREEFYSVFTKKGASGPEERIHALSYVEGRILINDVPIPIAVNDKVVLALSWERNFSFHPRNPVRRFS